MANTERSPPPPSGPDRPLTAVAPSALAIMHMRTQGRPSRLLRVASVYASATDTGSRGSGCRRRMARGSWHGDLGRSGRGWGTLVRMTDAPTRTAIRTCPFCEAGCGLEITVRDQEIVRVRGRSGRCVQPRLHLSEGVDAEAAPRGPRPSAPPAREARRPVRRGVVGRSVRRDRTQTRPHHRDPRTRCGRDLHRQSHRAQPLGDALSRARWRRASAPACGSRQARSTKCRSRWRRATCSAPR